LDVEAAGWAKELGLGMRRVRALNDDAAFIVALAEIARSTLAN
jgi:protoheme ferro-lyase